MTLTLQQAKDIFIKHGECNHPKEFFSTFQPYKCNVLLTICGVCNKNMEKTYIEA